MLQSSALLACLHEPDVQHIGSVTGWLGAAALAHAAGKPVSPHGFLELSAHLMPATPTAHLVEHLDLGGSVVREPLDVSGGHVRATERPGSGVEWDEKAVARLLV